MSMSDLGGWRPLSLPVIGSRRVRSAPRPAAVRCPFRTFPSCPAPLPHGRRQDDRAVRYTARILTGLDVSLRALSNLTPSICGSLLDLHTPHDLRHSFASRALALGESLTMIGKLLGHTQVQTTARYAHLARDSMQTAASRITESIGENLMGEPGERTS